MSSLSIVSVSGRKTYNERYDIDNETLINEVQSRRGLWDQKSLDYGHRSLKVELWEAVAAEMNQSVMEVKSRWKHLKDSFNREIRNMTKSGLSNTKWSHFDQMSFLLKGTNSWLLPKIKNDLSSDDGLISCSLTDLDPESQNTDLNSEENEFSENSYIGTEENQEPAPKKRKLESFNCTSKNRKSASKSMGKRSSVSEAKESTSDHPENHNEDHYFLMSLLPSLESLSPKQKMLVKIKIMQDVYEATYGEGNSNNDNSLNISI